MEIIGASILVSVITTKILATYYFKKVDGYVKDMEQREDHADYPKCLPETKERKRLWRKNIKPVNTVPAEWVS